MLNSNTTGIKLTAEKRRKRWLQQALFRRGNDISIWRQVNGLSLVAMAAKIGVHWQTLYRWESEGIIIPEKSIKALIAAGVPEKLLLVDATRHQVGGV